MTSPDHQMPESVRGCGQRLRDAREAAGLDITDVAARLRMPVRVVESLESEDWSRLGAPVYVRGQLRSYGRLLGLATESLHAASGVAPVEPMKLVPRSFVPPMQRVAEQAARRIVYVVITALIAVPVWLATRPHLGQPLAVSAPLDAPTDALATSGVAPAPRTQAPTPIVASMTLVAARATAAANPAPASTPAALSLHVSADSWVKVMAVDGSVLEEALLRAGDERRFAPGHVGGFVIGNAGAAELRRDGRALDLAPFLRANVARFAVSSDGSLVPAAQ